MATLFTAWTPGEDSTSLSNLFATSEAVGEINAPLAPPGTSGQIQSTPRSRPLIGIVAGHWKNDSGAVCPDGLQEVDLNLNIATLVQKFLTAAGFDVELLAENDVRLLGYQASALVSVHADSCDYVNNEAKGFKVVAALATRYPERTARLTACLVERYGRVTTLPLHLGSITQDMTGYHAFDEINPNTPAAIIETGFMNLDRDFLTQKPDVAAQGIAEGIICFIRNEIIYLPTATPPPQSTP